MKLSGVEYDINWRKFKRGSSIFIPSLDPEATMAELRAFLKQHRIKTVHKFVIADGIRGVRVWKM